MPSFKTYCARVKLRTIHPLASRQLDDRIRRQWRTDTGAVVAVAAAVAARLGEDAHALNVMKALAASRVIASSAARPDTGP